jgi:hypothetical protein
MSCNFGVAVASYLQIKRINVMMGVVSIQYQQGRTGSFMVYEMTANIRERDGRKRAVFLERHKRIYTYKTNHETTELTIIV